MRGAGASAPQIRTEYEPGAQALYRAGPGGRTLHNLPQSQPGQWITQSLRDWVALANFVPVLDLETQLRPRLRLALQKKRELQFWEGGNTLVSAHFE